MAIYKDKRQSLDVRIDAAKACLNFERHRLATTHTLQGPGGSPLFSGVTNKDDVLQEVQALIDEELGKAGSGTGRRTDTAHAND